MDTYEKKYKEALLKAREAKQNTESAVTIGILEEIFPELRESEDERIRKKLIGFVENWEKYNPNSPFNDYAIYTSDSDECNKILAWLEKQGEPTEVNPTEFDLRLNRLLKQFESLPKEELISNLKYYLNIMQNDGTYKIEKQGKESIIIDADPNASYDNVMISDIKNNKKQDEKPQRMISAEAKEALYNKLAWSEEDENVLQDIEEAIINYWHEQSREDLLDWLKSLKERIGG